MPNPNQTIDVLLMFQLVEHVGQNNTNSGNKLVRGFRNEQKHLLNGSRTGRYYRPNPNSYCHTYTRTFIFSSA